MSEEILELGKDLDHMAMATDARPLKDQILGWLRNRQNKNWPPASNSLKNKRIIKEKVKQEELGN